MIDDYRMTMQNYTKKNNPKISDRLRAAQKLAALGGNQPDMQDIPRRR